MKLFFPDPPGYSCIKNWVWGRQGKSPHHSLQTRNGSSGRLRLESIFERKKSKERSALPRARAQRVHAGARVAPSPVALIIEQIFVVSNMSGSRNIKTCKTRGRRGGSLSSANARPTFYYAAQGAPHQRHAHEIHAVRMRNGASYAMASCTWHAATPQDSDRVHPLRGDAVQEPVHVICIILRAAQCNMWLPGDVPPCMCTTVMEHVMACRRGF